MYHEVSRMEIICSTNLVGCEKNQQTIRNSMREVNMLPGTKEYNVYSPVVMYSLTTLNHAVLDLKN
jgi:hypothetical protein